MESGLGPWAGWADMHKHYHFVRLFPSSFWKSEPDAVSVLELYRWGLVVFAFINVALFGVVDEARQHYLLAYTWLATKAGLRK